jgi:acyl-CoA thioesterase-1
MRVVLLILLTAAAALAQTGREQGMRPLIVFFGDSLTEGLGLDSRQSFPSLVQQTIEGEGYHYRVENFGVSGDTTQDGLARIDMVIERHPSIVVLEFGANDGLRGEPVSNIEKNLAQLIEQLRKAHVAVLLAGITLPPNYGTTYISRFASLYPSLAKQYQIKLIPFLLQDVAGHANLMQRDGLHPNAEGEKTVARTVWQYLKPLLRKP